MNSMDAPLSGAQLPAPKEPLDAANSTFASTLRMNANCSVGVVDALRDVASAADLARLPAVVPGDHGPVQAPDSMMERRKSPLAAGLTVSAQVD